MTKSIVLIHGLFMNPKSWTEWKRYFEEHGFTVYAPAYPYHTGEPADLRRQADPQLARLTFGEVTKHLADFIDKLPEKPILIGHSMGGLAVQKLIGMNKGVAGACIDSAPPRGIFCFEWSFLRANLATINPFKGDSICLPGLRWFRYAFCNTMGMEETKAEYEKFVVPESRNIPRSSAGTDGRVDFKKPHAPLLFIAGEKDHIIPASLNRSNFKAYKDPSSLREFREFPGRTHYICGQANWKEVADHILAWIVRL
jgi:pimeloyl-ACP methyl ester carboxylesterase